LLWLGAATLVIVAADRLLDVRHGLNAVYFAGTDWRDAGASVAAVDAPPSSAVLKQRRPDFAEHAFSVEWRGFIVVPRSGTYTFSTVSDDGSWLYVRGTMVVENPGRHSPIEARGNVTLQAGVHPIFIRYFQDGGDCVFEASWARADAALEPLSASPLLTEPVSYPRAIGRRVTAVALALVMIVWCAVVVARLPGVAFRATGRLVSRSRGGIDPALVSVLLLSMLLNVWGIWWALPNTRGWAPDELVPVDVLEALRVGFSHGWHTKYPPFHYAVIAAADAPILLLSWLGIVDLQRPGPYTALFLIGRFVSLALGIGTIIVVYLCGRELYGSKGAVFAALTTALMAPFVYHGKLANLDVPYLFWFAVSLLAYVRILERHARRDYLLFAVSAALAVCTKDQAYGLYVLTPLAILASRWHRSRIDGRSAVNLFDRTTLLAAAVGAGVFVLAGNLVFNFDGFVEHVKEILGPTSSAYQMFEGSPAGQLRMAGFAIQELRYIFGWPLAAIVAIGVVRGVSGPTRSRSLRGLLVPALSYYATFIGVVLYFFDRFLLPIALVLSLFAGYWLERFVAPTVPLRRVRMALVSAAFAYSVISVVLVNYALTTDSRYAVTRWMQEHVGRDEVVAARGPLEYFMIADGFTSVSVESVEDVAGAKPAFIVLNADQIASLPPGHAVRTMHDALLDGRAGYRLALRYRTRPLPWPGRHPDLGDTPRRPAFSSLSQVNPTLEVFERERS
jgi:4-amino-4-deoxy-L-arabinose transferase-like glycosyltransferase